MSLNQEELNRTRAELQANFELSGVTLDDLRDDLDFSTEQLTDTLAMDGGSKPEDVWLLRDHLEDLVRDEGRTPVPYTVLTEGARAAASVWFPLAQAPARR
ncbi:MAG TPA: DUF2316 family protein [Actinocrinis sp.]|nr:DUF2316 family protein [Actinocrinis sp.]